MPSILTPQYFLPQYDEYLIKPDLYLDFNLKALLHVKYALALYQTVYLIH